MSHQDQVSALADDPVGTFAPSQYAVAQGHDLANHHPGQVNHHNSQGHGVTLDPVGVTHQGGVHGHQHEQVLPHQHHAHPAANQHDVTNVYDDGFGLQAPRPVMDVGLQGDPSAGSAVAGGDANAARTASASAGGAPAAAPAGAATSAITSTSRPTGKDFKGGQAAWQAMLYSFLLFRAGRGAHAVPKPSGRSEEKALHHWVQNQRKHCKLLKAGQLSSMTEDRLAVLEAIDFPWNFRGDSFWQRNFEALKVYKAEHGNCLVPRGYEKVSKLGEWVTDQRKQFKQLQEGKPSLLTAERRARLDELNFAWKIRERIDWNDRYGQLLEYKADHKTCQVPQHYSKNKALGKWVAKQREQYRFRIEGKHSFLTEERIKLLGDAGFVWSVKGKTHKKMSALEVDDPSAAMAAAGHSHGALAHPTHALQQPHHQDDPMHPVFGAHPSPAAPMLSDPQDGHV
jgi:hypothetical protein